MSGDASAVRLLFKRHQHLARPGDSRDAVFLIESGWACRYHLKRDGKRQIVALFLPGEYCEAQWYFHNRATGPIVALTDARVRSIDIERDGSSEGRQVDVLSAIMKVVNVQAQWIVDLGSKTAIERVSSLLCQIFDRLRASGAAANGQCSMPLTQYDIADIVGLTPVHVNRVLKTLRAEGLVELASKRLRAPDLEALRLVASG